MSEFALRAERFVLPGRLAGPGFLTVRDGKFAGYSAEKPSCKVVDLGDSWVGAGLVDTHIHGFYGHATTDCDADGMNEASLQLARRGTTSWLPTTFTDSADAIELQCKAIADARDSREPGFAGARVQGIYLEGPFFTLKHKGAQNPKYLVPPSVKTFERWQRSARGLVRKSALAPEYPEAPAYVAAVSAQGVVCALGHSDATYQQCVEAVDAGATVFVHTYNGMRGLHHREPGVVGAAMVTPETYAELICDGHHVVPAACAALVRAKGWEHVVLITDCLGCGGLPEGNYMSGGLPVVLKDGLCWLADMSAIAGSVLTLAQGVKNMVDWGIVSPEQAIRMGSEVAARSAGVAGCCGYILPGRDADLNVYAPDLTLRATYVGGAQV